MVEVWPSVLRISNTLRPDSCSMRYSPAGSVCFPTTKSNGIFAASTKPACARADTAATAIESTTTDAIAKAFFVMGGSFFFLIAVEGDWPLSHGSRNLPNAMRWPALSRNRAEGSMHRR